MLVIVPKRVLHVLTSVLTSAPTQLAMVSEAAPNTRREQGAEPPQTGKAQVSAAGRKQMRRQETRLSIQTPATHAKGSTSDFIVHKRGQAQSASHRRVESLCEGPQARQTNCTISTFSKFRGGRSIALLNSKRKVKNRLQNNAQPPLGESTPTSEVSIMICFGSLRAHDTPVLAGFIRNCLYWPSWRSSSFR